VDAGRVHPKVWPQSSVKSVLPLPCTCRNLSSEADATSNTDSWYDELLVPEERKEIMMVMAREVRASNTASLRVFACLPDRIMCGGEGGQGGL